MEQNSQKILQKIDLTIARKLKPYGKRFGYILILTEADGPGADDKTFANTMHMVNNGYAASRESPQAIGIVLGIIEDMARFLRTGKVSQ